MYLTPLLLAALGIQYIWEKIEGRVIKPVFWVSLLLLVAGYVWKDINNLRKMTAKDTRLIGLDYFEKNGVSKDNSVIEAYTPFSPGGGGYEGKRINYSIDQVGDPNIKYVVLSSVMYTRQKGDKEIFFYNWVGKQKLIKSWSGNCKNIEINFLNTLKDPCTVGPTIKLYEIINRN